MKKQDFKDGMSFETECGKMIIFKSNVYGIENEDLIYTSSLVDFMRDIDDDLNCKNSPLAINKVYDKYDELIWERSDIDWNKIPKNTKVLVRDSSSEPWRKRYFYEYVHGVYRTFASGCTSWSCNGYHETWKYCKLYEGEDINE